MKLFIDGADPNEIRVCVRQGLIDGVVTDRSLKAEVGRGAAGDPEALLREICGLVKGPVTVGVAGEDRDRMLREGRELARLAPNVVVSLPFSTEGLQAVRACANEGIKTNVTLCLNPEQALLAAKAGAAYLSPSVERGDGVTLDAGDLVRKIVAIYRTYGHETQVLFGVRTPSHIVDAALAGAHVAVVPYKALQQLGKPPLPEATPDPLTASGNKIA